MLSKLSRRRGLQLEALGSVLICTVMLADPGSCLRFRTALSSP